MEVKNGITINEGRTLQFGKLKLFTRAFIGLNVEVEVEVNQIIHNRQGQRMWKPIGPQ